MTTFPQPSSRTSTVRLPAHLAKLLARSWQFRRLSRQPELSDTCSSDCCDSLSGLCEWTPRFTEVRTTRHNCTRLIERHNRNENRAEVQMEYVLNERFAQCAETRAINVAPEHDPLPLVSLLTALP